MLDAKRARELSMEADKGRSDAELEAVEHEINGACDYGHTSVSHKGKLLSTTAKRLENLGYVVTFYDDQREGTIWTTISW